MTRDYIIYRIVNSMNDKVYVGYTSSTLENRFIYGKFSHYKRCVEGDPRPLYSDMRSLGFDKFSIEQIDTTHGTVSDAKNLEEKWINSFDSDKLYNISRGNGGTHVEGSGFGSGKDHYSSQWTYVDIDGGLIFETVSDAYAHTMHKYCKWWRFVHTVLPGKTYVKRRKDNYSGPKAYKVHSERFCKEYGDPDKFLRDNSDLIVSVSRGGVTNE